MRVSHLAQEDSKQVECLHKLRMNRRREPQFRDRFALVARNVEHLCSSIKDFRVDRCQ